MGIVELIGAPGVLFRAVRLRLLFLLVLPGAFFLIRYVAPPLLLWITWVALRQTVSALFG